MTKVGIEGERGAQDDLTFLTSVTEWIVVPFSGGRSGDGFNLNVMNLSCPVISKASCVALHLRLEGLVC